jgi:hypothetical protein
MTQTPNKPHQPSSQQGEPSGSLDSGFLCDLVGTTSFGNAQKGGDSPSSILPPSDEESHSPTDAEAQRSKIPAYKQGKVKTALLFVGVAIPMGFVGFMMFGNGSKPAEIAKKPEPQATPAPKAAFEPDSRFGVVQNKLAMQDQNKMLEDAAKEQEAARMKSAAGTAAANSGKAPAPGAATVAAKPEGSTTSTPAATPDAGSTPPSLPPTNVEPPPKPEPAIVPKSYPKPSPVAIAPKPEPQKIAKALAPVVKPETPVVRQRLASRSSVAAVPAAPMPRASSPSYRPASPTVQPTQVSWQQATNSGIGVFGAKNASAGTANPTAQALVIPGSAPQPTNPNISQTRSSRKIIAGQNRAVSLISPMQILANEQGQEVLIQVDEGFVDSAGGISIPAGTRIIADVTVASNGLLRITTAKALINNDEISISTGSLILTGTNNAPVFAQLKQFGQDEIGRRDMQTFLAGAVQGIGDVLTQPDTQTQIAANGTAISSTTNKRDYIGGILKGGGTPILQQWAQRNQAEVQRLEGATRLWHLPVGFKMSLVAVRPFSVK